jgi:hypothetical protein
MKDREIKINTDYSHGRSLNEQEYAEKFNSLIVWMIVAVMSLLSVIEFAS